MKPENYKILLADDDADIIEILSYNLKEEGYAVYTSNNGYEALTKAVKIKPELILLDIMMPDIDGFEVCRKLKNIKTLNDTIIAFLSARTEDELFIEGFAAGADDYIKKPIRPKVLSARIKALLRRYVSENIPEESSGSHLVTSDLSVSKENYMIAVNDTEQVKQT